MHITAERTLFWAPRLLVLLFAGFVSMFALDVFWEVDGFWTTIGAFFVHLIPTAIVLLFLAVAWRREWLGALLLFALAVFYVAITRGRFPVEAYLSIGGPLLVASALFLGHWLYVRRR